jgi:plastocyanin
MSARAPADCFAARRRGVRVLLPLSLGIAALLALGPVAAGAATVSAAWSAKIGSAGVNGKATISASTTGTGTISLKLAKLKASTLLPVVLHKGTCSSVGAVLLTLPSIRTTSTGSASRTSSLTAAQVSRITLATTAGTIAIRIGTGSARKCGLFRPAAGGSAVSIANFAFALASMTVAVGTTVTWTNNDSAGHTVTADDGSFKSDALATGATFSQTFATAGTFAYHCAIHSSMKGTITVH